MIGLFAVFILIPIQFILRKQHNFKLIDVEAKLEKNLQINEALTLKLRSLIVEISQGNDNADITWLQKGNNYVFKLAGHPDVVFKLAKVSSEFCANSRFANMKEAKVICIRDQLHLLKVPQAKRIEVLGFHLIAEEALDFNPKASAQEELYTEESGRLNETARQLATFVAKTRFNDVTWRNIPLLNETENGTGPRKVALIDLEHMKSAKNGFVGDPNGSCGLIRCVARQQLDIVKVEAIRQGIQPCLLEDALSTRIREIESNERLRQFYARRGVVIGNEPIAVDLDTLQLNLDETKTIKVPVVMQGIEIETDVLIPFRIYAQNTIASINAIFQNASPLDSIKGKRYIRLGGDTCKFPDWMKQLVKALHREGHIYSKKKVNTNTYLLQA
ncbi:MAG: hypothetical protein LW832_00850 [Parachlamydia sp.]|nr:hypothetical protein [Parachlamydia sp.]